MNTFDPGNTYHHCGDYLNAHMLYGRRLNDAVFCSCNKIWALVELKRWRYLLFWRVQESNAAETLWWRDKAAEKARDAARAVKR